MILIKPETAGTYRPANFSPITRWEDVERGTPIFETPPADSLPAVADAGIIVCKRARGCLSLGWLPAPGGNGGLADRGRVVQFSRSSRYRLARWLRECAADYCVIGTATVQWWEPTPECGIRFKQALDALLVWLLGYLRERDPAASITWFLEFQSRGAPHVHWFQTGPVPYDQLADQWARIAARFNFGDLRMLRAAATSVERLRAGGDGAIGYALKYAVKQEQKDAPAGYWPGRFWGIRGDRRRGSCHLVVEAYSAAVEPLVELRKLLKDAVKSGLVREIRWLHGRGAIYVPRGSRRWPPMLAGEIELAIMRAVLIGRLVRVDEEEVDDDG